VALWCVSRIPYTLMQSAGHKRIRGISDLLARQTANIVQKRYTLFMQMCLGNKIRTAQGVILRD